MRSNVKPGEFFILRQSHNSTTAPDMKIKFQIKIHLYPSRNKTTLLFVDLEQAFSGISWSSSVF